MRRGRLLLAALCAAACARQPVPSDAPFRLTSSATECRVGQPFLITVERSWTRGQEPPAWDPATLQALDLTWEGRENLASGDRMGERLRYRARVFAPGEYSFAPYFSLRVSTGLPAADAGILEAPAALSGSWRWTWRWIGWPLGLAAGLIVRRMLRRRVRAPAPPAPAPPAPLRLQALDPEAPKFPAAFHEILRDWLAERAGGAAPGRLAEELLKAERGLTPAGRDRLLEIVIRCQDARFGGHAWPLEARRGAVAGALAIMQEAS